MSREWSSDLHNRLEIDTLVSGESATIHLPRSVICSAIVLGLECFTSLVPTWMIISSMGHVVNFCTRKSFHHNLVPRLFTYARPCRKDPGSRDNSKFYCLRGVRKVSNYMLPLRMTSFATAAMLEYIAFFSCLEFAVLNSIYENRILKPKQVLCMECLYLKEDLMCVLPTGYGKSLIFHLLPMLLFVKYNLGSDVFQIWRRAWRSSKEISMAGINFIIIVVSPLNSLMNDQIARLRKSSGIQASVIDVKELTRDEDDDDDVFNVDIDFRLCEKRKLRGGDYQIVFFTSRSSYFEQIWKRIVAEPNVSEECCGYCHR